MNVRPSVRLGIAVIVAGCASFGAGGPTAAAAQGAAAAEPAARDEPGLPGIVERYAVAARDLTRGEVLTSQDIERVRLPEGESAPEITAEDLVGWRTRRVIAAGEPLRPPAVSPPELVRAGEPVEVLYQGRSVVLRVKGTAAGSAAMGERVLVRVDAKRRLQGVVIGPALVQLESNESR